MQGSDRLVWPRCIHVCVSGDLPLHYLIVIYLIRQIPISLLLWPLDVCSDCMRTWPGEGRDGLPAFIW